MGIKSWAGMRYETYIFIYDNYVISLPGCKKQPTDEEKYKAAIEKYEAGEFDEAKEMFSDLNGYEDSDKCAKKSDVMSRLQGKYVDEDGSPAFSINKFRVTNWGANTTIKLNDSGTKIYFVSKEWNDREFVISFKNGKMLLIVKEVLDDWIYEKIEWSI